MKWTIRIMYGLIVVSLVGILFMYASSRSTPTVAENIPPTPKATVSGVIKLSSCSGVVDKNAPCPQIPLIGTQLDIFERESGKLVARAFSDDKGKFTVELSLGEYFVKATPKGAVSVCEKDILVSDVDKAVKIKMICDSGVK